MCKEQNTCNNCDENEATELHTCPYRSEIDGNYDTCNCCADCEHECCMDI